jgi:hypothetical protein
MVTNEHQCMIKVAQIATTRGLSWDFITIVWIIEYLQSSQRYIIFQIYLFLKKSMVENTLGCHNFDKL